MTQEILYTSAQSGLKPGSRGFCTVVSTTGMARNLAERLESLSGYRHAYPPHSDNAHLNPVAFSNLIVRLGGCVYNVLSRVGDAGKDYSGRSNKLAHHVALESSELVRSGPVAVLKSAGMMHDHWDGKNRLIPARRIINPEETKSGPCLHWRRVTGDAGWAGWVVDRLLDTANRPLSIIFSPGTDTLTLVDEVLRLMPDERRWGMTFSTYFTKLPAGIECRLRFVLDETPEAKILRSRKRDLLDLTLRQSLDGASKYIVAARTGNLEVCNAVAGIDKSEVPERPGIPSKRPKYGELKDGSSSYSSPGQVRISRNVVAPPPRPVGQCRNRNRNYVLAILSLFVFLIAFVVFQRFQGDSISSDTALVMRRSGDGDKTARSDENSTRSASESHESGADLAAKSKRGQKNLIRAPSEAQRIQSDSARNTPLHDHHPVGSEHGKETKKPGLERNEENQPHDSAAQDRSPRDSKVPVKQSTYEVLPHTVSAHSKKRQYYSLPSGYTIKKLDAYFGTDRRMESDVSPGEERWVISCKSEEETDYHELLNIQIENKNPDRISIGTDTNPSTVGEVMVRMTLGAEEKTADDRITLIRFGEFPRNKPPLPIIKKGVREKILIRLPPDVEGNAVKLKLGAFDGQSLTLPIDLAGPEKDPVEFKTGVETVRLCIRSDVKDQKIGLDPWVQVNFSMIDELLPLDQVRHQGLDAQKKILFANRHLDDFENAVDSRVKSIEKEVDRLEKENKGYEEDLKTRKDEVSKSELMSKIEERNNQISDLKESRKTLDEMKATVDEIHDIWRKLKDVQWQLLTNLKNGDGELEEWPIKESKGFSD